MRALSCALLTAAIGLTGCSQKAYLERQLNDAENRFKDHIGFFVYDPAAKKTLAEHNATKYFTPASNTKIFTFYSSLQLLGDSLPGLKYSVSGDSLIFAGTGDPSFLYADVARSTRVFDFLRTSGKNLYFSVSNFQTESFGPGWAWDDYPYYYSAERSSFPVYGNLATVQHPRSGWEVTPRTFRRSLVLGDSSKERTNVLRKESENLFVIHPGKKTNNQTWHIPFRTDPQTVALMLSDTLGKTVQWTLKPVGVKSFVIRSLPSDSLYKVMLQASDNFIAEQLLLMCAAAVSDTLKPEIAIQYVLKKFLFDLPDKPIWVDGSGLSRYNLFTPRSLVRLWEKIYAKVPQERLFKLVAVGGRTGTMRNSYAADKPFIFGKTGSLSNNHALSGFLITKKGRLLIFSFMNSNFVDSQQDIRKTMEKILTSIRDNN